VLRRLSAHEDNGAVSAMVDTVRILPVEVIERTPVITGAHQQDRHQEEWMHYENTE
jgi:phosphoribosylaminoimidazole-succinocarboxamide synthase